MRKQARQRVLVACEFSGIVRSAFEARGFDAWSCDLLPTEQPGQHIVGNVLDYLDGGWDLIVAHPPCTYLANSGVRWLEGNKQRMAAMREGAEFFRAVLAAPVRRVAVENPIMHKYARDLAAGLPDQVVQPWMFGHGETKATCLWLRGLPLLKPTNVVGGREARVHRLSPGPSRWKERSRTYLGIAEAMAEQWAPLCKNGKGTSWHDLTSTPPACTSRKPQRLSLTITGRSRLVRVKLAAACVATP